MSGILKHLCGLETCRMIRLLELLDVFENPSHSKISEIFKDKHNYI